MTPLPRPVAPPVRLLGIAFGVVAMSGAALVAVPDAGADSGLSPRTVARYLADAAPDGARDVRISGVYGSGHRGTWQFTGFLTWRDTSGAIQGGSTELPQNGGRAAIDLELSPERVVTEHDIGWTEHRVARALSGTRGIEAELAMVELAITSDAVTLLGCSAKAAGVTARCSTYSETGRTMSSFADRLVDVPYADATSVQRESAPLTTPY
jgi:hypothetical protein